MFIPTTYYARYNIMARQMYISSFRSYDSALHSSHRITYMGARRCYHERILESHTSPEKFLSAVADTMAQNHMMLPWLGNLAQPKACLPQKKMTAVLCHTNRCFVVYKFFS